MIYLDNNATTRIAPEVFAAMQPFLTDFYGNPSSAYSFGRETRQIVEKSREQVASLVGAKETNEIIFTSCGTESDNWAILGALEANPDKKHLVTTEVEHEAVGKVCRNLEKKGYAVSWLGVDEKGQLNLDELKSSLRPDTAIVSTMLANNETGILFPINEIGEIIKANSDALFHVDGVNAVGKIPINLQEIPIDLFSLSGHKFHAPKGIGALYVREGVNLPAFLCGGGQEAGRRAGTEAVHQIVGFGTAANLVKEITPNVRILRDKLEDFILQNIPDAKLNGTSDRSKRLPNTASIAFPNLNGEVILAKFNQLEICVSTGSACNADNHVSSAVLRAMNVPYTDAMGTIRFSLGRYNTEEEIDFVIEKLPQIVGELREFAL
jgi:cysteine desulfurase